MPAANDQKPVEIFGTLQIHNVRLAIHHSTDILLSNIRLNVE